MGNHMGRIGYWAEVAFMSLTTAVMGGFAIAVIWGGVIDGTVTGTAKKTVFGAVCVAMTTFMALRLPRYFTQRRSEMRPAERVWSQEEIADFKVANILALVALRRLMRLKQGEDRWLTIAATCASLVEMITLIVIDGVWRPFFGYASPLALFQTVSTFVLGIIVVGGMIVVPLLAVLYYSGVLFERRHKGELDDITREFELIA
ncbi:MAG: hypothetical protein Q8R13_00865, partial [bacterium]|nr:hypothetical protein [bacterium]